MFEKFKIEAATLESYLNSIYNGSLLFRYNYERKWEDYYDNLLSVATGENGVVDGNMIKDFVFPLDDDYNVFISYSHNDANLARNFAHYLSTSCGLKVFLDEFVWGSADKLLKTIDYKYCMNDDKSEYIYHRRNLSTSYVHALLSMSIMDVISRTECCIFIDSEHSIYLDNLQSGKEETLSPWLYEEIRFMNQLPKQAIKRTRYYSREGLNESFMMKLAVDTSGFHSLSSFTLSLLNPNKGTKGLDIIYDMCKIY